MEKFIAGAAAGRRRRRSIAAPARPSRASGCPILRRRIHPEA